MKKLVVLAPFLVVCLLSVVHSAQSQEVVQSEKPAPQTAEQAAADRTEKLRGELSLSEAQYKKVYKLFLKEARRMEAGRGSLQQHERPSMERPPMGRGGMTPPDGSFEGRFGSGEKPKTAHADKPSDNRPDSQAEIEKREAAREKAMKKILSADQYAKWQATENQRRREEFGEMLRRQEQERVKKEAK